MGEAMKQTIAAVSMLALVGCYEGPTQIASSPTQSASADVPASPPAVAFGSSTPSRPLPQDFLTPDSAPLGTSVMQGDAGMDGLDAGTEPVDAGFVGPAGSPCEFLAARATQADLAKTPRASGDAEWLAIELSGALLAPDDVYADIEADLTAIRAAHPEVSDLHAVPRWASGMIMKLNPQMAAGLDDGGPFPWDCLNAYYGGTTTGLLRAVGPFGIVSFAPRMNSDLLVPDYGAVSGVVYAESDIVGGDGNDICVVGENGGRVYIFDRGSGDCLAGCSEHVYYGFRVDPSGVTDLGSWDSQDAGTRTPPNWVTDRPECKKHL